MNNYCNHVVAIFYDNEYQLVCLSELKRVLDAYLKYSAKNDKKIKTCLDILDQRRGYCTIFDYCPFCGEKLNWPRIKARLRNTIKVKLAKV